MRAVVIESVGRIAVADLSEPAPGPYAAIVRIHACGICNTTDVRLIDGTYGGGIRHPAVLGHESVGTVVEIGSEVRSFKLGDRVTRPAAVLPGRERDGVFSAWGGMAEVGMVEDRKVMPGVPADDYLGQRQRSVRDDLPATHSALCISLAETASFLVQAGPVAYKRVVVGGTGVAGLSIALWCRLGGAERVVVLGRRQSRLELAGTIAADAGVNTAETDDLPGALADALSGKADLYVDAIGSTDVAAAALPALARGATIANYGIPDGKTLPVPAGSNLRIVTPPPQEHLSYDWVADLVARGIVKPEWFCTREWPLEEGEDAFRAVRARQVVKGFLVMDSASD